MDERRSRYRIARSVVALLGPLSEHRSVSHSGLDRLRGRAISISEQSIRPARRSDVTGGLATERVLFNSRRCALSSLFWNCLSRANENFATRARRNPCSDLDRSCCCRQLSHQDEQSSVTGGC